MARRDRPAESAQSEAIDFTEAIGPFEQFEKARRSSVDQHILISRNENGKPAYVATVGAHDWTPEATRDRYGPGLYKFRLRSTTTNEFGPQVTIALASTDAPQRVNVTPIQQQQPQGLSGFDPMGLVQTLLAGQQQIMATLVSNIARAVAPSGDSDALIRAIELGARLAARSPIAARIVAPDDNNEDEDDSTDLSSIIKTVLGFLKPQNTPAAPALAGTIARTPPPQQADSIAATLEHFIRAAVAARSINPDTYADAIIGAIGHEETLALVNASDSFTDVLISAYPDLAGHADRLETIEASIRDRLGVSNDDPAPGANTPAG